MNDNVRQRLQTLKELEDAHKAAFPDGDNTLPEGGYTEAQRDALDSEVEITYAKEDVFDALREHIDAGDVGTLKALRENPTLNRLRNELLWLSEVKRGLVPGVVADKGQLDIARLVKEMRFLSELDMQIWTGPATAVAPEDADRYTKKNGGNDA
jgi:hypothetical protein